MNPTRIDIINEIYNFDLKFVSLAHKDTLLCAIVLNDGRFTICSDDESIVIYNNITFNTDIIIKEDKFGVNYFSKLSSGMLASCSWDNTIKIFNIKNNNYKVIQILNSHEILFI